MLDERKTAILSAVVQEYIATAQPVGSTHIAQSPGVKVSSATVRNEMAVLEQEGYLIQPHTSAGRVPTDKGYRFFVDHLTRPGHLDAAATLRVGEFFRAANGRLEELLHRTSELLAGITNYASVVVGPKTDAETVRSVQLVGLSAHAAAVVVVFAKGSVENETIELAEGVSDAHLAAAATHLSRVLNGGSLADVSYLPPSGDAIVDRVCVDALAAVRRGAGDDSVFVGGASSVARSFDAVDVVRDVLQALEQHYVVVSLITDVLDRGLTVAIGVEHGVEPLAACAVVVAPISVDGEHLGSIGVLGPTRMNYPQALATVEVVSEQLGKRMVEG